MVSTPVTGHAGGFVARLDDGPRVDTIGFVTGSGEMVTIPREAFDTAAAWVREQEPGEASATTSDAFNCTLAVPRRVWEWWAECHEFPISEMVAYLTEAQEADRA